MSQYFTLVHTRSRTGRLELTAFTDRLADIPSQRTSAEDDLPAPGGSRRNRTTSGLRVRASLICYRWHGREPREDLSRTARGPDGHLGVEDVLAGDGTRTISPHVLEDHGEILWWGEGMAAAPRTHHIVMLSL